MPDDDGADADAGSSGSSGSGGGSGGRGGGGRRGLGRRGRGGRGAGGAGGSGGARREVQEQAGKLIKEAREPCFEEDIAEFLVCLGMGQEMKMHWWCN